MAAIADQQALTLSAIGWMVWNQFPTQSQIIPHGDQGLIVLRRCSVGPWPSFLSPVPADVLLGSAWLSICPCPEIGDNQATVVQCRDFKEAAAPMNGTQTTIAAASDAACSRLVDAHQHPVNWLFRVACFLAAIPMGGVWLVGCWLNPSGGPLGIERQLGTARCGFYAKYGIPCPTCGWTTAVSHLYHGQIFQAFFTQPAGAIFGVLMLIGFAISLGGLLTGRWMGPRRQWILANRYRLLGWCALILAVSWVYKIWAVHCWPWTMR
jgi:hypothetical protein